MVLMVMTHLQPALNHLHTKSCSILSLSLDFACFWNKGSVFQSTLLGSNMCLILQFYQYFTPARWQLLSRQVLFLLPYKPVVQ